MATPIDKYITIVAF